MLLQASADQPERALAASMLNSLWEEFHFFNNYPVKQLTISAALFGTIIQQRCVLHPNSLAVSCVVITKQLLLLLCCLILLCVWWPCGCHLSRRECYLPCKHYAQA